MEIIIGKLEAGISPIRTVVSLLEIEKLVSTPLEAG